MSILSTYNKKIIYNNCWWNEGNMAEEDWGDREQCGRITSRNEWKYHIMTVSEWHKIKSDGDQWQPTCWLQMAHNDDDDVCMYTVYTHQLQYRSEHPVVPPETHQQQHHLLHSTSEWRYLKHTKTQKKLLINQLINQTVISISHNQSIKLL